MTINRKQNSGSYSGIIVGPDSSLGTLDMKLECILEESSHRAPCRMTFIHNFISTILAHTMFFGTNQRTQI